MTYYHASTVGSNLKRLVVHPTLVENHIVVYATPERAVEAFGGDCEISYIWGSWVCRIR